MHPQAQYIFFTPWLPENVFPGGKAFLFGKTPEKNSSPKYYNSLRRTTMSIHSTDPDPPSVEFAGDSRRWVRRRTKVLQVPTNNEDPVKSAAPKGHKNEARNSLATNSAG
jgi:hypothetical protein